MILSLKILRNRSLKSLAQQGLVILLFGSGSTFQAGLNSLEFSYTQENRFISGLKSLNIEKETLTTKNDVFPICKLQNEYSNLPL